MPKLMKFTSVLLVSCFFLSGCAMYKPKAYIPPSLIKNQYLADVTSPVLLQTYNAMAQSTAAEQQAKVGRRNQIMTELIALIDQNYATFESRYYSGDALVNFGGDVANLGLTGVASVTGTAHLKSILTAIAAGTTGMKISYEKSFFDGQARSAIVQKMRSGRALELSIIQDAAHMRAPVTFYSIEAGLSDIAQYYEAGTIIGALQAIALSAGQDQSEAAARQKLNAASH